MNKLAVKLGRVRLVILGLVAATVLSGGVLAFADAWTAAHMTSTGTITVTQTATHTYTVPSTVLVFGNSSVSTNGAISVSATVAVNVTGSTGITGYSLTNVVAPAGLAATITGSPIAAGSSGVATVTLSGTAPATAGSIDLSTVTMDITPG